jgi:cell division septation protein DedD
VKAEAKPDAKAAQMAPVGSARPGAWIVQVISLQDRAAAGTIARGLAAKGYPAFVLDPAPGAPRIYRVQVGGYADKNDAEQASRRLEKDEQFKPLVRSR